MNCIIIDDDITTIKYLSNFIKKTSGLELISSFTDPIIGFNFLQENHQKYDLLLLDIEMPSLSGLDILKMQNDIPNVIVISGDTKYAYNALQFQVSQYLLKPIDYPQFLKAVSQLKQNNKSTNTIDTCDYLFLREDGLMHKVQYKDICLIEALGDYIKVHTQAKMHVVNSTMKNIEEKLSAQSSFVRVHRSYIINLDYLSNFDNETAILKSRIIPIGTKYKNLLQEKINILH